jgi:hypothetical protein
MLEEEAIGVQRQDGDGDGICVDGRGAVGLPLTSTPMESVRRLGFVGAQ